jgi:hypothetical protein
MSIAIIWLFFAVLVGIYASRQGRSGLGWFLLATVISPLLAILLCLALGPLKTSANSPSMPSPATHVKCPDCRELVLHDARVCKHCGAKLIPVEAATGGQPDLQVRSDPSLPPTAPMNFAQVWSRNKGLIIVIGVIGLMALLSALR